MASLPAPQQPQSQRRSSPGESQPAQQPSPVRARSATSEDSQTLFLHSPSDEATEQKQEEKQPQDTPQAQPEEEEPKKCWICFADSTEDTPETSAWRDPCPCALVAHEECLLDWIADTEAPKNSRNRNNLGPPRIECPQCKAEIKLARPKDYVVEAFRVLERAGAKLTIPGSITLLSGSLYTASLAWGIHSIYSVFGADDGFRIMRPLLLNWARPPTTIYLNDPRSAATQALHVFMERAQHWRLYLGIPLITPLLILSRTRFARADSALTFLPTAFFATQVTSMDDPLDVLHWPPSASFAFAMLPYIRSAYNFYYEKVWAEKERRWMKEIQPRSGATQCNQGDAQNAGDADDFDDMNMAEGDGDENVFEVRIDGGIWEEWEEPPAEAMAPVPPRQEPVELPLPDTDADRFNHTETRLGDVDVPLLQGQPDPMEVPPLERHRDIPIPPGAGLAPDHPLAEDRPPAPAPPAQPAAQVPAGERRLSFSPISLAETILGAILFPSIAGITGELLTLVLPKAWTMAPGLSRWGRAVPAKGLLQQKWGRSLVGGCAFVVVKDALVLYVRWRMAQMHRRRRVLDHKRG